MPSAFDIVDSDDQAVNIKKRSAFDEAESTAPKQSAFDLIDNERTALGTAGDVLVSAGKGVVGLGESAAGIANLATGGLAGKALNAVGYDPKKTQETLSSFYSPAQQAANKKVDEAKGFVNTATTMLENPSTIAHNIIETVPTMLGGAGAARKGYQVVEKFAPKVLASTFGKKWGGTIAGAAGEGLMGAGSSAEQMRQESPDKEISLKQGALAGLSGLGTSAFGIAGGALAKKLGVLDFDTWLATGGKQAAGEISDSAKQSGWKKVIGKIVGGGISEGVFEEMPQSAQETVLYNAAMDKPLMEGVLEAMAQGAVVGGAMGMAGGGISSLTGRTAPQIDPATGNIAPETQPPVQGQEVSQGATESAPIQQAANQPPVANLSETVQPPVQTTQTTQPIAGIATKAIAAMPQQEIIQPITDTDQTPPPAPQAAPGQEVQPPPVGPLDQLLQPGVTGDAGQQPSSIVGDGFTATQPEFNRKGGEGVTPQELNGQQQDRENIIIRNPARTWILAEHGPDVVRELSAAKNAGAPISIAQAKENIKARTEEDEGYARDQMYDFIDQAEAGQANEDTKFRKAKFDKLRSENATGPASTDRNRQDNGSDGLVSQGSAPVIPEAERNQEPAGETGTGIDRRKNKQNMAGDGQRLEPDQGARQDGMETPSSGVGEYANTDGSFEQGNNGIPDLPIESDIQVKKNSAGRTTDIESPPPGSATASRSGEPNNIDNIFDNVDKENNNIDKTYNLNKQAENIISDDAIIGKQSESAKQTPSQAENVAKNDKNSLVSGSDPQSEANNTPDASTDQQLKSASAPSGVTSPAEQPGVATVTAPSKGEASKTPRPTAQDGRTSLPAENGVNAEMSPVSRQAAAESEQTTRQSSGQTTEQITPSISQTPTNPTVAEQQKTDKTPDKSPYTPEQLSSITVQTKAWGEPQTMTASAAIDSIDSDISLYEKIRNCVG